MACSICGQEGHTKRTHDRRYDRSIPYWSDAGWVPRPRRRVVTDRSRAERIALGHEARKAMLGQALTAQAAAEEVIRHVDWMRAAVGELRDAAAHRRGSYRRRDLDDAVDAVLRWHSAFEREIARSPWGGPLAQPPPDAVS